MAYGSELIVRVPAGYLIPNHNHTSAETYIWLKGQYTYIDGGSGQKQVYDNPLMAYLYSGTNDLSGFLNLALEMQQAKLKAKRYTKVTNNRMKNMDGK